MARTSKTKMPFTLVIQDTAPDTADITAVAPDEAQADMPASGVRILRPFGFQDDYGDAWFWHSGMEIRNPYVLSMLIARGAPTEPLE